MNEDDLNNLSNASDALSNMLNADNDADIEEQLIKFEYACYDIFYNSLMDGYVYEKVDFLDTLDFYLRVNDEKKYNVSALINKHYPNAIQEKLDEYIKDEKYEMCKPITELLNYNTINYDK